MSTTPSPPGLVFVNKPTGPITRLRVVGRPIEFDLTELPNPCTIGRRPNAGDETYPDIQLDHELVSLSHALLERRGDRLWCDDRGSTNGTYVRNDREASFVVKRGLMFRVAEPILIALDDLLVTLRQHLAWSMGLDDHAGVDHALARIVDDQPVLLIGPRGCDQAALSRAIHEASGRRDYPFMSFTGKLGKEAEHRLEDARWGTVFVDLYSADKVTNGFARTLLGVDKPELHLRPIIAGPDLDQCHAVLGQLARAQAITLPGLDQRRHEVPRLLKQLLSESGKSTQLDEFGAHRVARLAEREWPQNLDQLREAAERLAAVRDHKTLADAAATLSPPITRQALGSYLDRLFGG